VFFFAYLKPNRVIGKNGSAYIVGDRHPRSKPVNVYTLKGCFVGYFASGNIAAKELGVLQSSLNNVCNGKSTHTQGYVIKFAKNDTK